MENKEIKIDEKEIQQIKENRGENNKMMFDFGKIKLERISLDQRMKELDKIESDMEARYKGNINKEQKVATKLSQKYGDGHIDLDKGVFISNKKK
tara:strand:+ start:184 stop:468 length:285 start_codon:yes stop_codon:yes gene_type:complete